MEYKKNRVMLGMLFLVFVFFVLLVVFSIYTLNVLKSESVSFGSDTDGSIAVVTVKGPIMDSKKVIELLHDAEKDKTTQAIIVRIDSPGGSVGPSQEIYEEIRRIDTDYDLSNGKKGRPVYASFGSMAASGGYYIGVGARKIYSNPGTLTGSIGVISMYMDLSKLYKWAKMNPEVLKAGRFKDASGPHRPLTEQERKIFEERLEEIRQQFVAHILETRKKKIKGSIDEIAQGQIFTGEMALKIGLVDELASLWTAGRRIHDELELKGEFGLKFIEEKKKKGLWRFLEQLDDASTRIGGLADYLLGDFSSTPMFLTPSLGKE